MIMRKITGVLFLFISMYSIAQPPAIVKAVGGTVTEPYAQDQEGWKNNEWNGLFFYRGTGSPLKLCVTDGTNAGTIFVANLNGATWKATIPAQDFMYIITNGTSFSPSFTSTDYIYRSDGTAAGTSLVYTMPGISSFSVTNSWTSDRDLTRNFSVSGNTLYFGGYDAANGNELWVTDGTAAGTRLVKDVKSGTGSSNPFAFCKIGSDIFFTATATGSERKLWKTDGTGAGTVQVAVAEPFFILDNAVGLVNNKMIFYAHNTVDGFEPWVSDGTAAGTFMLKDIHPAGNSWISQSQNAHLRFNNKHCYFIANNGTANALWRTDGTSAGTIQLTTDAQNVSSAVSGGSYTDIDQEGIWLIQYDPGGAGASEKLYRSNGTPGGTNLVATGLSYAQYVKIYKNALWMASRNTGSAANVEPWRSGGNGPSTNRAFEIAPGLAPVVNTPISANPFGFFVKNNKLYFFASSNASPDRNLYEYTGGFTFTPVTPGRLWSDSANWSGRMPPGITDSVLINYNMMNNPVVTGRTAYAGTLLMNSTFIQLTGNTDSLIINKAMINPGVSLTPSMTGTGVLAFSSATADTVTISQALMANRMAVMSYTRITGTTGDHLEVYDNLNLVNNARVIIEDPYLRMMGNTSTITISGSGYIVTNGTGLLAFYEVGAGGRTGPVLFPVGSAAHYNPVILQNTGPATHFHIKTSPGLYGEYFGDFGLYQFQNNAVNATWHVYGPSSGSNVSMTLQWDESQELPGFNRTGTYLGHYDYNSTSWETGGILAASGTNPYTITRTGITAFSPFGVLTPGPILPLRFLSFDAQICGSNQVCLKWETANEQDVSHFEVERSIDGIHFSRISTISAKNQPLNLYSVTDDIGALPGTGITWYRIREVGRDGRATYSTIRLVKKEADRRVSVYPNPARDYINVLNWQDIKQLQVYSMSGKLVKQWNNARPGYALNGLPGGQYLLRFLMRDGSVSEQKIIRQ